MQKHVIVQGIVNDLTGDIHMTADQIRDEARRRSPRDEHARHLISSRDRLR